MKRIAGKLLPRGSPGYEFIGKSSWYVAVSIHSEPGDERTVLDDLRLEIAA